MNKTEVGLDQLIFRPPSYQETKVIDPRVPGVGADRAWAYLVHILKNEKIGGEKPSFKPGLLKELHKKLLFYYPGWAGKLREDDETRLQSEANYFKFQKAGPNLEHHVYLFESWLSNQIEDIKQDPENIERAVKLAAAAHYIIVADLHPFNDGNGRLARLIMNAILALNTREGLYYNLYTIPIPQIREQLNISELFDEKGQLKESKQSPYLKSLREVDTSRPDVFSRILNPFEIYIASKWVDSINRFFDNLRIRYGKNWRKRLNRDEIELIEKITARPQRLGGFLKTKLTKDSHGNYLNPDFVPEYTKSS